MVFRMPERNGHTGLISGVYLTKSPAEIAIEIRYRTVSIRLNMHRSIGDLCL